MDNTLLEIWRYTQVVLGISLVIFVHEAGHFIAARLCKVRVDVFSLGFGPKLFGWRRGPTLYQVALLPLGGYVKMAGEEGSGDGRRAGADELPSKSVGQRFLIYSGGVLANVAFALIVFPFILAVGLPTMQPVLGPPEPGSPAWHAGLEAGTRVRAVNGTPVTGFLQITSEVALGSPEEVVLEIEAPPEGEKRVVRLVPVYSEIDGVYTLGVTPPLDPSATLVVQDGSPASTAGLKSGDRLLDVSGGDVALPGPTPAELLRRGEHAAFVHALSDRVYLAAREGRPFRVRVERDGTARDFTVQAQHAPKAERAILGVAPIENHVIDLRNSPVVIRSGLQKDDRLLDVNGVGILRSFDLARALAVPADPLRMRVMRDGTVRELSTPALSADDAAALLDDIALANDQAGTRVSVYPGSAAEEAGLEDGDRILRIDGGPMNRYKDIQLAAQGADRNAALTLSIERRGTSESPVFREIAIVPRPWHPLWHGMGLTPAEYVYKANGPIEAVRVGVAASWKFLEDSWLTLKRILFGQVSSDNVGGIITIGVVSHSMASAGLAKLFFFLCMLSMNLAFLNVLPIPMLDGGHLFFLLIEKVKGSPVSERVLGYSQMVGIVLILSLMVFATFNDVRRWIFS